MPPIRERKRVSFTAAQKKAIHDKKQVDPRLRDEDIAKEYGCARSTITKILNDEKWKNTDNTNNAAHAKSAKKTTFPRIQEAMELWLTTAGCRGLTLTGDLLKLKAREFAAALGPEYDSFKASDG